MSVESALELLASGDLLAAASAAADLDGDVGRATGAVAFARAGRFAECRERLGAQPAHVELDPSADPPRGGWTKSGQGTAHPGDFLTLVGLSGSSVRLQHALPADMQWSFEIVVRRRGGSDDDCAFTLATGHGSEIVRVNARQVVLATAGASWPIDGTAFNHFRLDVGPKGSCLAVNGIVVLRSTTLGPRGAWTASFGVLRGALPSDTESHWLYVAVRPAESLDEQVSANAALAAARIERRAGRPERALAYLSCAAADGANAALLDEARLATAALAESDEFSPTRLRPFLEALPATVGPQLLARYVEPREVRRMIVCDRVGVRFAVDPSRRISVKDLVLRPFRRSGSSPRSSWWALQDVSFDLSQGDILGVIGANGAGKSTLLRVLAGMLAPDAGRVAVQGRPLLLTPGLGFREELSGRDNIYLGGVFLGLRRREIARKFDQIVDFAELRAAIDRPFKFYSDGMKARLIFSVATAVEPDLLMLDELLSAGDAHFQEKAATRLRDLLRRARAIVVVTHSMGFVRDECTKALYLESGGVRYFGDPTRAVERYLTDVGAPDRRVHDG